MEASKYSDHELVRQFINGEQSSFEILIKRHKDKVYTYIFLMVKNNQLAEDIFQETFIKVIKSLHAGKYQENGKFISWVVRIAHNLIIDHFRKEKQMKTFSNDDYENDLFNSTRFAERTIEETIIQEQIETDLRKMVEFLPQEQKEVIILRHYLDLSFKEIAEQTNVSINTALGRMRYALINLRKLIEEKNLSLTYR
ncbi:MAG: RNA polymerase subunit sigma-24 [Bacteroidetes bacterium GWC2_33_15]|nr:MAG: RNA polymerase subunit sigma-24 [Bacteroidetes bacterium GWA2_33_15]OFX49671.1 MAG: RNA polymerase subunit sigma-24 [Bacteroidetes bacterium GWC2_33_15]OFX65939.1 MAG: RNA polymerase subunit sigma-24 [Bacteroidetes bacterium GWB2_32_14]OFX68300.1 MAG: RNA polymerase subunit sigma-24 [Bacteroidetes bacterium GWD2_33_33]HAN18083.1 RNA polymerase subunit sigma-24 [Bacteroidales bacterium]